MCACCAAFFASAVRKSRRAFAHISSLAWVQGVGCGRRWETPSKSGGAWAQPARMRSRGHHFTDLCGHLVAKKASTAALRLQPLSSRSQLLLWKFDATFQKSCQRVQATKCTPPAEVLQLRHTRVRLRWCACWRAAWKRMRSRHLCFGPNYSLDGLHSLFDL